MVVIRPPTSSSNVHVFDHYSVHTTATPFKKTPQSIGSVASCPPNFQQASLAMIQEQLTPGTEISHLHMEHLYDRDLGSANPKASVSQLNSARGTPPTYQAHRMAAKPYTNTMRWKIYHASVSAQYCSRSAVPGTENGYCGVLPSPTMLRRDICTTPKHATLSGRPSYGLASID